MANMLACRLVSACGSYEICHRQEHFSLSSIGLCVNVGVCGKDDCIRIPALRSVGESPLKRTKLYA